MKTPRWLSRLGSSALIGGQALAAVAKGKINLNELLYYYFFVKIFFWSDYLNKI